MSDVEKVIKEEYRNNPPQIHCIVLSKFDIDSLRHALIPVKDLPVKIFVNCKNSKRKNTGGLKSPSSNKAFLSAAEGGVQESEGDPTFGEDVVSRHEVYFTGRENIEGYACLVNVFLNQMLRDSQNPSLINIDNEEEFTDEGNRIKKGQLFF